MSQENVEIVRRMLAESDRRDGEAVFAAYDPDIEFDMSEVRTIAGIEDSNRNTTGMLLEGSSTTKLTRNRAIRNGALGIQAGRGVIDGGGNIARHNGDPRQCVNVTCH